MKNKLILALSGNDIFSGGGLHADLTTYTVNGLHGFVAVTCLTAMIDKGFEVIPVEEEVFAQQLSSLKDVPFSAIKLGLLPNVEVADLALDYVKGMDIKWTVKIHVTQKHHINLNLICTRLMVQLQTR